MNNENTSATTNAILVILLVLVVGFIVWFVAARGNGAPATVNDNADSPSLEVNLGNDANGGTDNGGTGTGSNVY